MQFPTIILLLVVLTAASPLAPTEPTTPSTVISTTTTTTQIISDFIFVPPVIVPSSTAAPLAARANKNIPYTTRKSPYSKEFDAYKLTVTNTATAYVYTTISRTVSAVPTLAKRRIDFDELESMMSSRASLLKSKLRGIEKKTVFAEAAETTASTEEREEDEELVTTTVTVPYWVTVGRGWNGTGTVTGPVGTGTGGFATGL